MSDTQSSEEYEVRVEQKMEAKLRDLLDRAKNITPFYNDDTLLLIYKDCFYTDQVFLNKLEIIAKNHKIAKQEEDQDWIQFKQQQKVTHRDTRQEDNAPPRQKYHFLEDEELIQRAKYFDIERERDLWERRKEDRRQKQQNKYRNNNNKPKYQQKAQNQEPAQKEKKLKFKQKVQPATSSSINNQPTQVVQPNKPTQVTQPTQVVQPNKPTQVTQPTQVVQPNKPTQVTQPTQVVQLNKPTQATQSTLIVETPKPVEPVPQVSTKPAPKYAQKRQKFVEKKVEPEPVSIKKQEVAKQQAVKEVKQPQKPKYQEKVQKPEATPKVQQPKIEAPQPKQQTKVAPPQQKVLESPAKKIGSQKQLQPDIKKEFEESCRLNSFILKFIPPSAKLQKISYIRDPNGSYREVKTREPLVK